MKKHNAILLLTLSFYPTAYAQEETDKVLTFSFGPVLSIDDAVKKGFSADDIMATVEKSRKDLAAKIGAEEVKNMKPTSISLHVAESSIGPDTNSSSLVPFCNEESTKIGPTVSNLVANMGKITDSVNEKKQESEGGVLYVSWGYNRGYHTKSDVKIETDKGDIIIKDAVGKDRPVEGNLLSYLKPSKLTVPQYNVRIGYWINKKWGVEIGTDHMKWVFDPSKSYEIEGNYIGDLWVKGQKKNFDDVKAGKDASFLLLEHSDGYNYPFLGVVYREKLINTKRFETDAIVGGGAGILFPKTRTRFADQENTAQFRDIDNKFHVAGYAAHLDARLRMKYKQKNGVSFYVEPAARGVAGKINNALFLGSDEGKISQTPIFSLETMISVGTEVPLKVFKGQTKEEKELKKMKKQEKEEQKLLTKEEEEKLSKN
jgi:hypothetical protein